MEIAQKTWKQVEAQWDKQDTSQLLQVTGREIMEQLLRLGKSASLGEQGRAGGLKHNQRITRAW